MTPVMDGCPPYDHARCCRPEIHVVEWYEPRTYEIPDTVCTGRSEEIHCDECGSEIYHGMVRCFCNREILWEHPRTTVEICEDGSSADEGMCTTLRGAMYLARDADLDEWAEEKA